MGVRFLPVAQVGTLIALSFFASMTAVVVIITMALWGPERVLRDWTAFVRDVRRMFKG